MNEKSKLLVYMLNTEEELKRAGYLKLNRKYTYKYQIAFPLSVYKVMWEESKKPANMFYHRGGHLYYTNIYNERIYVKKLRG